MKISPLAAGCLLAVPFLATAAELPTTVAAFQSEATRHHVALVLPTYPETVEKVRAMSDRVLNEADAALARLAALAPDALTFENTFAAYDAIAGDVSSFAGQIETVAETHPTQEMRDTAREMSVRIQEWGIALDYREDIYRALKAFADTNPKLDAQEQRLMDFELRNYRRAGLALPAEQRAAVEQLRKQLSALEQEFSVNINQARAPLDFSADELAGVPQTLLGSPDVRQPDGRFRVMAHITWHYMAVMDNATKAATRQRLYLARNTLAKETNVAVLARLVALRADIADRLGYATWADYRTEVRMAKTGATALKFEEDLVAGLQPKFAAELATLRELKRAEAGDAQAEIEAWDPSYYMNLLKKQRYAVDEEQLRVFFAYEPTLRGMFDIYQRIFGLTFTEVTPPWVWTPGVQLFVVTDASTDAPIGSFYLDMFPREGKYNHFACFPQMSGRVLPDGRYELPVATLVCNFPPPAGDAPSLLSHDNVETLFHEFGHVMHMLLGRARFQGQTSGAVPRDFVEAPSQMLESWVWDKKVLDTFAADYRDRAKKIPAETIEALTQARVATDGYFNRRQLSLGLVDLSLHTLSFTEAN
ncbi:MAG TPA: M3 family metallopeptidase, partial [Opitutus sp.]|nr:M3 family metallopeptidase [Opitutus sp.]